MLPHPLTLKHLEVVCLASRGGATPEHAHKQNTRPPIEAAAVVEG